MMSFFTHIKKLPKTFFFHTKYTKLERESLFLISEKNWLTYKLWYKYHILATENKKKIIKIKPPPFGLRLMLKSEMVSLADKQPLDWGNHLFNSSYLIVEMFIPLILKKMDSYVLKEKLPLIEKSLYWKDLEKTWIYLAISSAALAISG